MKFFKKPTLEFVCQAPGVDKLMPIIPAKDLEHQWLKSANRVFVKHKRDNPTDFEHGSNVARCPGITHITKEGWIVRLYQDVFIETFGDGSYFEWKSAIDQTLVSAHHKFSIEQSLVQYHHEKEFFAHQKNWPANTLKTVIKFVLPWSIRIPKGYDLIQMPIAYLDENRFTPMSGIMDSSLGSHPCIIQLYWHVLNGKVLLKAGTPVAQFILKKKESIPWKITGKECSPEDFRSLIITSQFMKNYNKIKDFFK